MNRNGQRKVEKKRRMKIEYFVKHEKKNCCQMDINWRCYFAGTWDFMINVII